MFKRKTENCSIRCPKCGGASVSVIDSRAGPNNSVRRRRVCRCGERFTTYEMIRGETEMSASEIDDASLLIALAFGSLERAFEALEKLRASPQGRRYRHKGSDHAKGIAAGARDGAERVS